MWLAIMASSSVAMTRTSTVLSGALMQAASAALAAGSRRSPSHARRVLADAGGEDQPVQPTERTGHRGRLARDAIGGQLDCVARVRIVACEQDADVAADARHAEQALAAVEHVLDIAETVPLAAEI